MFWTRRVEIAENERGLLFRSGNFVRVLFPGRHRFAGIGAQGRVRVDVYDLSNPVFEHPLAGFLVKTHPELRESVFQVVELGDHEVGLQLVDGRLTGIVPPATQVIYWRGLHDVRVEIQDISNEFAVPAERVGRIGQLRHSNGEALAPALEYAEVEDGHVGLLLVNGRLERVLAPGSHAFWRFNRTVQVRPLDMRLQTLELRGQELVSKEKQALRLDVAAGYRVADPKRAWAALSDFGDYLQRELASGLREAARSRTRDELLSRREELGDAVAQQVRSRVAAHGLELGRVALWTGGATEIEPSVSRRREVVRIRGEPEAG